MAFVIQNVYGIAFHTGGRALEGTQNRWRRERERKKEISSINATELIPPPSIR